MDYLGSFVVGSPWANGNYPVSPERDRLVER